MGDPEFRGGNREILHHRAIVIRRIGENLAECGAGRSPEVISTHIPDLIQHDRAPSGSKQGDTPGERHDNMGKNPWGLHQDWQ